jgi:hypothetical protein
MKPIAEIEMRMGQLIERISILDNLKTQEMAKPIDGRNGGFLLFINKERSMYAHSLQQFQWILNQEY